MKSSKKEAPSSRCSVSVWYQEKHQILSLHPGTTVKELLNKCLTEHGLPVPKITIDGKEYDKSLVPYDASGYGEERALTRAQEDYTLERMGWFPSGVLVLRDSREEGKKNTCIMP
mmetsp:Transcript_1832/g.2391  ORF Transcript_1832/g.2391 Transcript_1832/m.2391 type:complete len:115 (+) Transcript_1832:1-345(+)